MVYFATVGTMGAQLVANLLGVLNSYISVLILSPIPPLVPQHYERGDYQNYENFGLGKAVIYYNSFELVGNSLVYQPTGGLAVNIVRSGRLNWFLLVVPSYTTNVIFWRGPGTQLIAGQQYVIESLSIPLAD